MKRGGDIPNENLALPSERVKTDCVIAKGLNSLDVRRSALVDIFLSFFPFVCLLRMVSIS